MLGARSFALTFSFLCACALGQLWPASADAQTIDLSLNIFYTTPGNVASGGSWQLVGKSTNFGIAGAEVRLKNISSALQRGPRATVNGNDPAGFSIFADVAFPAYRNVTVGQAVLSPLGVGEEQGLFYGVGQLTNGAPDWPGKPGGSNVEGPVFTSLTSPIAIPWGTGDVLNDPAWATAALLSSGTFAPGVTPSFETGSSGNVFASLGTSTVAGNVVTAALTTTTRIYTASADYNRNGVVDGADYVLWRNYRNVSVPNGTLADGNGDGIVNQADYDLWRSRFGLPSGTGSGGGLSTGVVPEPNVMFLAGIGAMLAACLYTRPNRRTEWAFQPLRVASQARQASILAARER